MNQNSNLQHEIPTPVQTVVMTITLNQERQISVNIIPPEVSGVNLQNWEVVGLIDTASQLIKNAYLTNPSRVANGDNSN